MWINADSFAFMRFPAVFKRIYSSSLSGFIWMNSLVYYLLESLSFILLQ